MWILCDQVTVAQNSGLEDAGEGQRDRHGLRHDTASLHTPLSCMCIMPLMSLVPDAALAHHTVVNDFFITKTSADRQLVLAAGFEVLLVCKCKCW